MTLSDVVNGPAVQPDTIVTIQLQYAAQAIDLKEEKQLDLDIWNRRVENYAWNAKKGLVISLA